MSEPLTEAERAWLRRRLEGQCVFEPLSDLWPMLLRLLDERDALAAELDRWREIATILGTTGPTQTRDAVREVLAEYESWQSWDASRMVERQEEDGAK